MDALQQNRTEPQTAAAYARAIGVEACTSSTSTYTSTSIPS
jgi:hypothetical protein